MPNKHVNTAKKVESTNLEPAIGGEIKPRWADLFDDFEDLEIDQIKSALIGARLKAHFSKLSNNAAKALLAELAAPLNLKVSPIINVEAQVMRSIASGNKNAEKSSNAGKSQKQNSASPKVKEIRGKINDLNKAIKSESEKTGNASLPEDHPLLVQRAMFFRDLKEAQSNAGPSSGGAKTAVPANTQVSPQ